MTLKHTLISFFYGKYRNQKAFTDRGECEACGLTENFTVQDIITKELASDWKLNRNEWEWFNNRESLFCSHCSSSKRSRLLAKAICLAYGHKGKSLSGVVKEGLFNRMSVAEINSCGALHQFLGEIEDLAYSEYGSKTKDIKHEDLSKLTYKDNSFDLVITSETLEHVPDLKESLSEIHRVLRPEGKHIFTVPIMLWRNSLDRIITDKNGKKKEIEKPSYHGENKEGFLVYRELGVELIDELKKAGFKVQIYFMPYINKSVDIVFVTTKAEL